MPRWVEDRKDYLLKKNPDMEESTAWALATQQARAVGKIPKDYGTAKGRKKAKKKYKKPSSAYEKKAKPKKKKAELNSELAALSNELKSNGYIKVAGFVDDLRKIALKK